MRRWALAAGAACAVLAANSAWGQFNTTGGGGAMMPGQIVGTSTGSVTSVGKRLPAAAPPVGLPITSNPLMRPYDPNDPYAAFKGTNLDPRQVIAPLTGPDGRPVEPPDTLDKLAAKLKAMLGLAQPALPKPPYVPGISRRNKERREQRMWRRD